MGKAVANIIYAIENRDGGGVFFKWNDILKNGIKRD